MQLNFNDDRVIISPVDSELEAAIRHLAKDEFLVLKDVEETYIQTYHNDDGTYQLEYRSGSAEEHFGVNPELITIDDVCRAFDLFASHSKELDSVVQWERMQLADDDWEEVGEEDDGNESMVEFQGVMMPESWQAQIENAQKMPTVSMSNENLKRIPFGQEQRTFSSLNCGDCGVLASQFHVPGCDAEQCPKCGDQLISCDCQIDED